MPICWEYSSHHWFHVGPACLKLGQRLFNHEYTTAPCVAGQQGSQCLYLDLHVQAAWIKGHMDTTGKKEQQKHG